MQVTIPCDGLDKTWRSLIKTIVAQEGYRLSEAKVQGSEVYYGQSELKMEAAGTNVTLHFANHSCIAGKSFQAGVCSR